MGSNARNIYGLKNGANKLEEINIALDLLEQVLTNLEGTDLNARFRYDNLANAFEGYTGLEWKEIGNGQMLGTSDVRAVFYASKTLSEDIVVSGNMNALIIDSVEIQDGGSITVEDGAVLKVV